MHVKSLRMFVVASLIAGALIVSTPRPAAAAWYDYNPVYELEQFLGSWGCAYIFSCY